MKRLVWFALGAAGVWWYLNRNKKANGKSGGLLSEAPKLTVRAEVLMVGSHSEHKEDVEALQTALSHLGYIVGRIDGIFGNATRDAVIRFQQDHGLVPDGIAGKETYAAIDAELQKQGGSFTYVGM